MRSALGSLKPERFQGAGCLPYKSVSRSQARGSEQPAVGYLAAVGPVFVAQASLQEQPFAGTCRPLPRRCGIGKTALSAGDAFGKPILCLPDV